MKTNLTATGAISKAAALTALALASGCRSSDHGQKAYYAEVPYGTYYSQTTTGDKGSSASSGQYGGTASAQNVESQTNMVVPLYKESVAVGKREVDAGSIRVRKVVKTETVNQPVELRHEEVTIERLAAGAGSETAQAAPAGQAFQEQETVIHLKREEPVVQMQTTSAGQIVLQRKFSAESTNIQSQARSEDVDVVRIGNPQNVTIGQNVQSSSEESTAVGGAESAGGQSSGGTSSIQQSSSTITDPNMLTSSAAPASFDGRSVRLSNLKVQSVVDDRLAVLNSESGQPLYAISSQGFGDIKAGDKVNLGGTIKTGKPSGLSAEAAQIMGSQSMYIDAKKIESAGR